MEVYNELVDQMTNTTAENNTYGHWKPFSTVSSMELGVISNGQSRIRDLIGIFFMVLLSIIALLANTAVIVVIIKSPQLRKFVFVFHLCVVDLLSAIFLMPLAIVSSSHFFGTVMFSLLECQVFIFLNVCLICASILTVTAISIERYYYIVYPMRYEVKMTAGLAVAVVVFIWIKSILLASIPLLTWPTYGIQGPTNATNCSLYWSPIDYKMVFVIIFSILCFFLPTIIIFIVYCSVYKVARIAALQQGPVPSWVNSSKSRSDSINSQTTIITTRNLPQRLSAENIFGGSKAAFTLIIIVGQFLLCWLPFFSFHLHLSVNEAVRSPGDVETIVTWLAYSSFAINPFFYGLLNRQIREELSKLKRCYMTRTTELGLSSQEGSIQENFLQFLQRTSCTVETRSSRINSSPRNTLDQTGFRIPGQIPE
ncbi:probable G-protein coupled receptor [Acipenser ruthenus]|uniref:probable G-protein coupled receptor n=1 Tax=Acipenser ruthenus TaxID=7906 RepID=UPI001560F27F|nr:probable G-protein coupled receptor [Acipenser ruthenus]XP_033875827.2 probable G-protein coupled receptor [Acipenser ruthenus]XP_033875828.2 probable G-protein coupled receptor [Acipenser ruthenus]